MELPLEQVPLVQKRAIQIARENAKPVIVATQMLESMIENSRPTRAEASDVANAVLDGADAVMLSGETSVGKYVMETVQTMARILEAVETDPARVPPLTHVPRTKRGVISYGARDIGERLDAKALVAFTQSGDTVRRLARLHSPLPLLAFTPLESVRCQLALSWGTETFIVDPVDSTDQMFTQVDHALLSLGRYNKGDLVVIVGRLPAGHSRLDQPDPRAPDRGGRPLARGRARERKWWQRYDRRARPIWRRCWSSSISNRSGEDTYLGKHPEQVASRTFGGQLVSQALVAAGRTVDAGRPVHAVNAHFIRGGDVKAPIEYRVERHRDGRAFANRQVTAYQDGNVVFSMSRRSRTGVPGSSTVSRSPMSTARSSFLRSVITWPATKTASRRSWARSNRSRCATRTILPGSSRAPVNASSTIGSGCAPTGSSGTIRGACRRPRVLVGHHRPGLGAHHPRAVLGLDRIVGRDRQSLDLVPSSVPVRRVGALRDGVSGRGRIAWSRNRSVLHAQGRIDRNGGAGRRHSALSGPALSLFGHDGPWPRRGG